MNHRGANDIHTYLQTPKGMNGGNSLPPSELWEAVRRVVFAKDVTGLATTLGIPPKELYRYSTNPANPSDEARDLPARLIGPMTVWTGRTDLIDYVAADCAGLFISRRRDIASVSGLLDRVGALTKEFADVQTECAAALTDERLTREERVVIQQQVLEMIAAGEGVYRALGRRPLHKAGGRP